MSINNKGRKVKHELNVKKNFKQFQIGSSNYNSERRKVYIRIFRYLKEDLSKNRHEVLKTL